MSRDGASHTGPLGSRSKRLDGPGRSRLVDVPARPETSRRVALARVEDATRLKRSHEAEPRAMAGRADRAAKCPCSVRTPTRMTINSQSEQRQPESDEIGRDAAGGRELMEGKKRLTLGDARAAMSLRVALVLARFRVASAVRMPRWGLLRHLPFPVGLSEQAYVDESSQVVEDAISSSARKTRSERVRCPE